MNIRNFALFFLCAAALGAAISYADSELSAQYIAVNTVISACAVYILYILHRLSSSLRSESLRTEDFIDASGRISYYIESKIPTLSAIERAAKSCNNKAAAGILGSTAMRMKLGEDIQHAINSASSSDKRIHQIVERNIQAGGVDFGSIYSSYRSMRADKDTSNASAMSRYSTVNMFISTVAPSFVIFSFIGSMLISRESTSIAAMSLVLVIALPIMYALSSSSLNRRLFG